jgi:hypothetical protein
MQGFDAAPDRRRPLIQPAKSLDASFPSRAPIKSGMTSKLAASLPTLFGPTSLDELRHQLSFTTALYSRIRAHTVPEEGASCLWDASNPTNRDRTRTSAGTLGTPATVLVRARASTTASPQPAGIKRSFPVLEWIESYLCRPS